MKLLSICIPTYEMHGQGAAFLKESLDRLVTQTWKDFDVVISDHSQDNSIEMLCQAYAGILDIHYYRNTERRGSPSANINNAIRHATGQLIKILFQDDFLYYSDALKDTVEAFDINHDHWMMSGCVHTTDGVHFFRPLYPKPNAIRSLWIKTVFSSPSTVTIKNNHPLLFDEGLIWQMDNDYYYRWYKTHGLPKVLQKLSIVNRVGRHQVTNTLATRTVQKNEFLLMLDRYEHGLHFWYYKSIDYMKRLAKQLLGKL